MILIDEDAIGALAEQVVVTMCTARNKDGLRIVTPGPSEADLYRSAAMLALQMVALRAYGSDAVAVSNKVTYI